MINSALYWEAQHTSRRTIWQFGLTAKYHVGAEQRRTSLTQWNEYMSNWFKLHLFSSEVPERQQKWINHRFRKFAATKKDFTLKIWEVRRSNENKHDMLEKRHFCLVLQMFSKRSTAEHWEISLYVSPGFTGVLITINYTNCQLPAYTTLWQTILKRWTFFWK